MPDVYDCCMFYRELDMLEARLNILDSVVDHFVVCEAAETHSGQPKPFYFLENMRRFEHFLDKIIYVQVDDLTGPGRNSWQREHFHRECIAQGLTEAQPFDLVIVGDCDEIPNPDVIANLVATNMPGALLEMEFYYYDLNHRVREGWAIGAMRWGLEHDPNHIRTGAGHHLPHIDNAGWHFSYFLSPEGVVDKVDAFMHHADVARDMPRDPKWVAQQMLAGVDLFGRTIQIDKVPLANNLPKYLLENLEKYQGWVAL
jgi:beta-1,4-mannosyl-glycoprotein beta-1,4-N-acetylglucosaminyltransferase